MIPLGGGTPGANCAEMPAKNKTKITKARLIFSILHTAVNKMLMLRNNDLCGADSEHSVTESRCFWCGEVRYVRMLVLSPQVIKHLLGYNNDTQILILTTLLTTKQNL